MIVVQDDFYPNPEEVREKALQEFFFPGVKGKRIMFPGQRTISSFSNENFIYVKNRLEKILNRKIIHFAKRNSNTAFTLGLETKEYKNWVHHDFANYTEKTTKLMDGEAWASVCYLTPNAPVTHGTGLFRDKEKQSIQCRDDLRISMESFTGTWEPNYIHMLVMYIIDWLCILQHIGMLHSTQVGGMIKKQADWYRFAFLAQKNNEQI